VRGKIGRNGEEAAFSDMVKALQNYAEFANFRAGML
jgi:hypothetical protein